MSKNSNPNREQLQQHEIRLLKEAMSIDSQLVEMDTVTSNDPFASLRKLTEPPKVDIGFYIGNMPNLW